MYVYGLCRLTRDVELRQTQTGISVASFGIASDREYQNKEEKITDFYNCKAWRNQAEFIAKCFHKGDEIFIAKSELQKEKYTAKDGQERESVVLVVERVEFTHGKKQEASGAAVSTDEQAAPAPAAAFEDEDVPF